MSNMANIINLSRRLFFNTPHQFRHLSSISNDLIRQSQKDGRLPVNHDILLNTIKTAATTSTVLDLVHSHSSIMNNKHLMQALRSLFSLQKSGNSPLSTNQILKHKHFEILCNKLRFQAGAIEVNETIEAIKVLSFVGVSAESTIVQVLLQLIRHQINNLSLHQIIFMDFLLTQMKPVPLVQALQMALPIVFEIQLPVKLDKDNIVQLVECLQYVSRKNCSDKSIEYMINKIMNYTEELTAKLGTSIVWSLCEQEPKAFFGPLIKRAIDAIILNNEQVPPTELETTLSKLTSRYGHKFKFYYNAILCDICANYVIDRKEDLNQASYLLNRLNKFGHASDKLMDYISTTIKDNPNAFETANTLTLYNIINSLALSDYKPKHWDNLKALLQTTTKFNSMPHKDIFWSRLCASLISLDIYKPDVLQESLKKHYIHRSVKGTLADAQHILLVYQAMSTFQGKLEEDVLISNYMGEALQRLRSYSADYPMAGALEKAFGGDSYLKTKVTTNLFHHIDHAVVLRKGGYPVALVHEENVEDFNIDKVKIGDDNNIVVILVLHPYHYTANNGRMKATTLLNIKTLEARNYTVVPICLQSWTELSDFEKIPYLMQKIKLKTQNEELVSNVI